MLPVKDVSRGREQVGPGDEQHVGQGDLAVHLHGVGAVDAGRLIQVRRYVHQYAGGDQHQVGYADPYVDQYDGEPRPARVRPEGYGLADPVPLHQVGVDQAVRREHLGNIQQRHELGNGDGHDQYGAPHLLQPDALLVDHDGHQHAQEVVQERGEEGPHQRPEQHLAEGIAVAGGAGGQQRAEVLQAHPGEQLGRGLVVVVKVGEGHQDHEEYGQYREHEHAQRGQGQQR